MACLVWGSVKVAFREDNDCREEKKWEKKSNSFTLKENRLCVKVNKECEIQ